jgi:hypothetical protein
MQQWRQMQTPPSAKGKRAFHSLAEGGLANVLRRKTLSHKVTLLDVLFIWFFIFFQNASFLKLRARERVKKGGKHMKKEHSPNASRSHVVPHFHRRLAQMSLMDLVEAAHLQLIDRNPDHKISQTGPQAKPALGLSSHQPELTTSLAAVVSPFLASDRCSSPLSPAESASASDDAFKSASSASQTSFPSSFVETPSPPRPSNANDDAGDQKASRTGRKRRMSTVEAQTSQGEFVGHVFGYTAEMETLMNAFAAKHDWSLRVRSHPLIVCVCVCVCACGITQLFGWGCNRAKRLKRRSIFVQTCECVFRAENGAVRISPAGLIADAAV